MANAPRKSVIKIRDTFIFIKLRIKNYELRIRFIKIYLVCSADICAKAIIISTKYGLSFLKIADNGYITPSESTIHSSNLTIPG